MSWLPRKRVLLAIHRWIGIGAALFLIILSITGLLLNHTGRLQLDTIKIRHPIFLNLYGIEGADAIDSYQSDGGHMISYINGQLFVDAISIGTGEKPVGIIHATEFTIIATKSQLIVVDPDQGLVERLEGDSLPYDSLESVGKREGGEPVLIADNGQWVADPEWLSFEPYTGELMPVRIQSTDLNSEQMEQVLKHYRGEGISLYRILLDLHSGRLFGSTGRTMADLTAVAVILLLFTGVTGWFKKTKKK